MKLGLKQKMKLSLQQVKKYVEAKRLPNEFPDASGNVSKPFHSKTLWAQAISGISPCPPVQTHMHTLDMRQ
jgi:hypothetical protein